MKMNEACEVVAQGRGDAILVSTMGAMNMFDMLGTEGGRISSVPLMGGAAGLGLGLALARPDRRVVVVDGDASLLMELGGLVTVGSLQPTNLLHVVVRNGTQFSGLANLQAPVDRCDFVGHALAAGYVRAVRFGVASEWANAFPSLLAAAGPIFVELDVDPPPPRVVPGAGAVQQEIPDRQFERMGLEAQALRALLAIEV